MFVQSAGDDLISISVANPREAQDFALRLRESQAYLEVVAGLDSVVVQFDIASQDRNEMEKRIAEVIAQPGNLRTSSQPVVEIPVCYGGEEGPDLESVCEQLEMTQEEFIALHSGREYQVDLAGFTPGFAYIGGLDKQLNVSRRQEPRVCVPAGSVGIAGGMTGLYALQGPGGWPLIGRTSFILFDAAADDPFVLVPGSKVVFVPVAAM
ncbi:MAG: 5-oxoprolinase subunit PxpB [Proteobacteria bacterium]|nr:5-oxoprolinase subunit PxpB [Pseudomonadota bacterium]